MKRMQAMGIQALLASIVGVPLFLASQATAPAEFEAISIKPSAKWDGTGRPPIPSKKGGPGTSDPGRLVYRNYPVRQIVWSAFAVKPYQISGPAWLKDTHFPVPDVVDIEAKIPSGATAEQVAGMLQKSLAERFDLKTHWEHKTMPGHLLTIDKRRMKLLPSPAVASPSAPDAPWDYSKKGSDGFFAAPPGYSGMLASVEFNRVKLKFMRYSMAELADYLGSKLMGPVTNGTELEGRYDFYLDFFDDSTLTVNPSDSSGQSATTGDLKSALQDNGLRLVPGSFPVAMLVIDHMNKAPNEN